ncbi:MAG: TonB-dependent receptor [Bacteroidia bacterium]
MKKITTLLFSILIFQLSIGQDHYTISGFVNDEKGNPLIGAIIFSPELQKGNTSNFNGHFEITELPVGTHKLVVSLLGYKRDTVLIEILNQNLTLDIQMSEQDLTLDNVEIAAEQITERTSISNISFRPQSLQASQGLTEDPIRTLSTLPGIGRAGDLFSPSQIYVRGGAPNENLFLIDNNKVYFPYYFGGQKSIFNTDAIESIEMLTGGFSAAYGNHMSSVMNVQTRDGDFENYHGIFSVGFYNASALFEGPIVKEKLSALIAVRRTYLDLFIKESASFPVTSLGDITYKISYKLNKNHKLSFSGLSSTEGMDFIAANQEPGLPNKLQTSGTNHFQSLQLKSSFGSKFYNKLSVTNTLNQNVSEIGRNLSLNIDAGQFGFRDDFNFYLSNKHKLKAGLEWQYGKIDYIGNLPLNPLETDVNDTTLAMRELDIHNKGEVIRSAYILYNGNPINKLGINTGIRFDQNPGGGYTDISPRFAVNYQLNEKSKARFSTGIYHQFADGEKNLKSSKAIHYILGYEYKITDHLYGWIEAYYKDYQNLVYFDSALNYSSAGEGRARGIELFVRKEKGNLRGWLSYSLSHSERTASLVGQIKDFDFDQRHIFNLVTEYHLPIRKPYLPALIQLNYRYTDGTPYTPIVGATHTSSGWNGVQGEPLSMRNNDYQNLNLRVEWRYKIGKVMRAASFIEIWNLTNHKNVLGRSYQYGENYPNQVFEQKYYATPFLFGGGFRMELGKE